MPLVPTTTLQDLEGNIQPASRGAPSTVPSDGTGQNPPVPKGIIGDKDSGSRQLLPDIEPTPNPEVAHSLGTDPKDHEDKYESAGIEGSDPDHN